MSTDLRSRIVTALHAFTDGDLTASSIDLLDALGYRSGRRLTLAPNTAANFARTFAGARTLDPTQAKLEEWTEADFLLQVTDSEVAEAEQLHPLREDGAWSSGVYASFALLAIGLRGDHYARTTLATAGPASSLLRRALITWNDSSCAS